MGPWRLIQLLNSVILIDHFNAVQDATRLLAGHGSASSTSVKTGAEVLAGCTLRTALLEREPLDVFLVLPISSEIADLADALRAAVATPQGLSGAMRNIRDLKPGGKMDVLMP